MWSIREPHAGHSTAGPPARPAIRCRLSPNSSTRLPELWGQTIIAFTDLADQPRLPSSGIGKTKPALEARDPESSLFRTKSITSGEYHAKFAAIRATTFEPDDLIGSATTNGPPPWGPFRMHG